MLVYVVARRFRANNRALITTAVITALLIFPLGASFLEIVREARIEAQVRTELTSDTVTIRRVRLIKTQFDWYAKPIRAQLSVSSADPMTSGQVRELQAFIRRRTGQDLNLVLHVSRYETVTDRGTQAGARVPLGAESDADIDILDGHQ